MMDPDEIGRKVIEMAGRVKVAHAVAPGAQADWGLHIDGVRYQVTVVVSK
jgi:hypothetical protein